MALSTVPLPVGVAAAVGVTSARLWKAMKSVHQDLRWKMAITYPQKVLP